MNFKHISINNLVLWFAVYIKKQCSISVIEHMNIISKYKLENKFSFSHQESIDFKSKKKKKKKKKKNGQNNKIK